jgi:hypothetical protein
MARKPTTDGLTTAEEGALFERIRTVVDAFPSRAEAAKVAEVSLEQIRRISAGDRIPGPLTIARLAVASGYSLDWVWTGIGVPLRARPHWPTFEDAEVGAHLSAAAEAVIKAGAAPAGIKGGPMRGTSLALFLRHRVEPALVALYRSHGAPIESHQLGAIVSRLIDVLGDGEPDAPAFQPHQWDKVAMLVIESHEVALKWASAHQELSRKVKKR